MTSRGEQGLPGQHEVFAQWYTEYLPRVLNYMRLRVYEEALAQDLTALTFERALSRVQTLRDEAAFGGWLFSIARTVVAGYYRHHKPLLSLDTIVDCPEQAASVESQVAQAEELGTLRAALAVLSDREREIIDLRFVAGLTNRSIAQALGIREGHVAVILYRALRKVRGQLAESMPQQGARGDQR